MTDASYTQIPKVRRISTGASAVPLPKPQPFGAPVLLSDCVTPLGGETLLSLLMKRMMQTDKQD